MVSDHCAQNHCAQKISIYTHVQTARLAVEILSYIVLIPSNGERKLRPVVNLVKKLCS